MTKLNKTETYLQNIHQRFKKTKTGVGAFLPTVKEFRNMNSSDKRFYINAVKTLKAKTPYQRSRDIYKSRTLGKLMYHFDKTDAISKDRKILMRDYRKQLAEASLALESRKAGIYNNRHSFSLDKKDKERLRKQYEPRSENQKDYMRITQNELLYSKQPFENNKTGKTKLIQFKFKDYSSNEVKDKLLKYDAYHSASSGGWVVITDTTTPAKNGSPRGTSVPSLMSQFPRGASVSDVLKALGQDDDNYIS